MKGPFPFYKTTLLSLLSCLLALSTACTKSRMADIKERSGYKPFVATNIYSTPMPRTIQRVAILPIYSSQSLDIELNDLDTVFISSLNQQNLFELIPISRDDMEYLFKKRQFNSTELLPANFLTLIKERYAVNGLIFIDLTSYQPYTPITLGVRSKFIDLSQNKIIWAFDTIFDAGDPHVALSARKFQLQHHKVSYPLDTGNLILKSPRIFAKFAAYQTFSTLPKPQKN